jgi:hypothetical protein
MWDEEEETGVLPSVSEDDDWVLSADHFTEYWSYIRLSTTKTIAVHTSIDVALHAETVTQSALADDNTFVSVSVVCLQETRVQERLFISTRKLTASTLQWKISCDCYFRA